MCSRSDIVGDFVRSLHEGEELRESHRKLVDILRTSRPVDLTSKAPEWNNTGNTPVSSYVRYHCVDHIESGWDSKKVKFIPNFVKRNNHSKKEKKNSSKIILCLGKFHRNKGIDIL